MIRCPKNEPSAKTDSPFQNEAFLAYYHIMTFFGENYDQYNHDKNSDKRNGPPVLHSFDIDQVYKGIA